MPSHCKEALIFSSLSRVERAKSVSSIRNTNVPFSLRANNQLNKAERAPPMWNGPVGLGAKRTFMELMIIPLLHIQKRQLVQQCLHGAQSHLAFHLLSL